MDYDKVEIMNSLLDRVKNNEHSSFNFLRSFEERIAAKQYLSATIATANNFATIKKLLMKEYCGQIANNTTDVETLLAIKQLEEAAKFYYKEADIVRDSLNEHRAYIFSGHILDTFLFGAYRPDEDCVDFRKLPWRFF